MIYNFKDNIKFDISNNLLNEYKYLHKYELDRFLYMVSDKLYTYLSKNNLLNNKDNIYYFNKIPKNEQYTILLTSIPKPNTTIKIYTENNII